MSRAMTLDEYLDQPLTPEDMARLGGYWERFVILRDSKGPATFAVGYREDEPAHDVAQSLMRIVNHRAGQP